MGARDCFLAERLHVERGIALPMAAQHAGVEHAYRQHVAKPPTQLIGVEGAAPRPAGFAVNVEDPNHVGTEIDDVARSNIDGRPTNLARPVDV